MHMAKISSVGQVTIPVEIRRLLNLNGGDTLLFTQNEGGEVVINKAVISVAPAALPKENEILDS